VLSLVVLADVCGADEYEVMPGPVSVRVVRVRVQVLDQLCALVLGPARPS
jgi:hypothetical protein